jgi:hypothetical protein
MAVVTHSLPMSAYPSGKQSLLQAGPSVEVHNRPDCGPAACVGKHAAGAIKVLDRTKATDPMLSNVAHSTWVDTFVASQTGAPILDDLRKALQQAGGIHTETDASSWVQIVGVPLENTSMQGVLNRPECARFPLPDACQCQVDLPHLFAPGLYGPMAVPLLLLNMPLEPTTPNEVVIAVEKTFHQFMMLHTRELFSVCMEIQHRLPSSAQPCDAPPLLTPSPSPAPGACANSWSVHLKHGQCPSVDVRGALIPTFQQVLPDTTFSVDVVDLYKATCNHSFPGFPEDWVHNYCAAFETYFCIPDGAQVVRFVLQALGTAPVPASLSIGGHIVTWVKASSPEARLTSGSELQATAVDKLMVLSEGCHHISVMYDSMEPATAAEVRSSTRCAEMALVAATSVQLAATSMAHLNNRRPPR